MKKKREAKEPAKRKAEQADAKAQPQCGIAAVPPSRARCTGRATTSCWAFHHTR
jgi:hypothetical protein